MRLPAPGPTLSGALLCAGGFALLAWPSLLAAAVGLELLAAGFWCWARAAEDRLDQLPRWAWLRRPASALWLAAGLHAVVHETTPGGLAALGSVPGAVARIQALAVLWGALELMAALPIARPFSDRPGPLGANGPWIPVMVPAAGFLVLWRHAPLWSGIPAVRWAAVVLLVVTACLAALRAFSRRPWKAILRWLVVGDCALAGTLVALRVVPSESVLLLWLGACCGHGLLLASELAGATPRRGSHPRRLWRAAVLTSLVSLSWPVLVTLGFGPAGVAQPVLALLAAGAVALTAWVSLRRMVEAPDRRAMVRRESAVPLVQIGALGVLAAGPLALLIAWWSGFGPRLGDSLVALVPALAGGWAAGLHGDPVSGGVSARLRALSDAPRRGAQAAFRSAMRFERAVVSVLHKLALATLAPARDLHTGDAREFLLFLAGVAVLALVLPLLR